MRSSPSSVRRELVSGEKEAALEGISLAGEGIRDASGRERSERFAKPVPLFSFPLYQPFPHQLRQRKLTLKSTLVDLHPSPTISDHRESLRTSKKKLTIMSPLLINYHNIPIFNLFFTSFQSFDELGGDRETCCSAAYYYVFVMS